MFTSVPSGNAHADAVPLPGLLFHWCQDYIIMKRRHEKTDREDRSVLLPSELPFRNTLLTASEGCYCWCWRCCCWLACCLMANHRPQRPTNHGGPLPFWSLIALSLCCLFFASECNKVAASSSSSSSSSSGNSKTPLCAFCGSDTFACGSNMEQALQQADNQSWPNFSSSSSSTSSISSNSSSSVPSAGQHSLNGKVQRMLLLMNSNHQSVFNSSNCTCIPAAWRCDRSIDCEDASDEIGCADSPVVPVKRCNPELSSCDNEVIDLENVDHNSTCKAEEFQCESDIFRQCIPKAFHCDKKNFDCVDRSDEIGCTSPTIVESSTEFILASEGETVTLSCSSTGVPLPQISWRRKGKRIVARGQRVVSSSVDGTGRLILRRLTFADQGTYTCEAANSMDTVVSPTSTVLVVRSKSTGTEGSEQGKEVGNLSSGSSNETAIYPTISESSPIYCPVSHFMCHNGLCISELYRCDGDADCTDGSDEGAELCEGANRCKSTEFLCPGGQCVPDESACPMQISALDCTGDNQFGEECSNRRHECTSGTFRCRDGSCVSLSVLCDGRPNCPEGSDEDTNSTCVPGVMPCREHGLPCQHLCVATNVSHFCACKEGYRKGQDGLSCLDIDECSIGSLTREFDFYLNPSAMSNAEQALPDVQVCSQLCTNFVPGFKCSCAPGYRLSETDRRRCTAIQGGEALLMTACTASDGFSLYPLDRFKTFTANVQSANQSSTEAQGSIIQLSSIASLKPIISMDYHYATNQIFWSDPKSKKIYCALMELNQKSLSNQLPTLSDNSSLTLHKVRPLIESGLLSPAGLAVDWLNHRLFWTDSATSRIEFSSLEGTLRKVLFHQFIHKPHSIAVHPEESSLFWSDWGEPPRIERAFMDGSDRQVIVSSLLSLPTGLLIDHPASRLYWADTLQNNLQSANLDGSDRFIMSIDNVRHPVSLTLFEDHIYFSSLNSPYIQAVSKLKGRNVTSTLIRSPNNSEFDIELKVLHTLRQPEAQSALPCHSSPCSHLCLPNDNAFRCSCPFGYSFEGNSTVKCQKNSNLMLIYTHARDIRAIALGQNRFVGEGDILFNDFNLAHPLPIASIVFAMSLDYDPITATLYWSDFVNKSIGRAKWSSGESHRQESILTDSLEMPGGVAIDWAAGNVYWVDTGRSVIEVARADGSHRSMLLWRSVDQPRDIVLDPVKALMFWSQWNNQTASIQRAGMDGNFRVLLHSLNLTRPNGLALDRLYRRVYWADSTRASIECSFYDGSDRRVVISKNVQHPFAVAIAGDFIYWSDLTQRNVQQAHKLSGEVQSILFEDTDNLMDIVLLQLNRTVTRQEFALTNSCHKTKCSHLCLLSPQLPGFRCACPTGISLLEDGHTCADSMAKYLIFTTRKAIRRISLQSEHHFDVNIAIHWQMENAYVLDVHSSTNMVFWSDVAEKAILRANMLTGRVEPVVSHGILTSNGLAIDDVGHKLYWTDADRKLIEVANLDGSFRAVLLSEDLDSPRAIAVNHKSGHLVWTDWGAVPRIERADMDGTARQVIVNQELGWPNGITITDQERIIWADSKFGRISQVDLNGRNRRVLAESLPSPYGVTVIDGYLYWTDWANKTINRLGLNEENAKTSSASTSGVEVFARSLGNLVDIRAVDQAKRRAALSMQSNMCQVNNGGCSHLCLRNSAPGYACYCPTGMTLLADRKTCNSDISWQLLLACKTSLRRISLDSLHFHDVYLPLNNLVDVVAVDYHYGSGQVFYIDASLKEIRAVSLGNLSEIGSAEAVSKTVVAFGDMSEPVGLAVDWIAGNLYWSDHRRHLLEVARLDGQSRMVLIDLDLNKPRCLQLLPERGFLFWIDSSNGVQHIERSFLDGSSRLTLFTSESGQLNGLAVEQGTEELVPRLFWTDSLHQCIESIRIDGTERQKVLSKGITKPFGIAVHGDFLFWSDSYNNVIERMNIRTNADYRLVADNIISLQELKIMAKSRQSLGLISARNVSSSSGLSANPCANDNGSCSHLCLFRSHGYICACPSYPDPRPCSTVPGETILRLTTPSPEKATDDELFSLNTSLLSTEATPKWNHVQPNENGSGNESLRLKELTDLCQDSFNLTRCNSRFAFDEHIIQVAYVLALILLSAAVLVCAILTFLCKRKIMEEEMKLSKLESPSNNVPHGVEVNHQNTSLPSPSPATGGSLSRTKPYQSGGAGAGGGEFCAVSTSELRHLQQEHNPFSQVPPPPPPPSLHICPAPRQLMEPHRSFVDLESHMMSHTPHLWFSSHTAGPSLENAPPYHVAMNHPFNWTNSLPRHDPAASMTMNTTTRQQQQYHHRSAMSSPYLGDGKAHGPD